MRKNVFLILLNTMWIIFTCEAQETNALEKEILNEDEIEALATRTETEDDYIDLLDNKLLLITHPVDINTATEYELLQLPLNDLQIKNLQTYITQYGEIAGIHELILVEGFDSLLVTKLSPYITFNINRELYPITLGNLLSRGKHQILTRYQTIVQKQKGYIDDSINLHNQYLGDPSKVLVKYGYNYYNRLRFGFLAEKDPGESLLSRKDSLNKGFDFYSFYFFYKGKGIIRNIAIGDYHLQFGQGLTMHSSFSITKMMSGNLLQKRNPSIKPSTGANENMYFRGAAITLEPLQNINFTLFYSNKKLDGVTAEDTITGKWIITSLPETGLHRTYREKQYKHSITQQVFGGNIQTSYRMFKVGATITKTNLSNDYFKPIQPYNIYDFRGNSLCNFGIDFSILYRSLSVYGEVSSSDNWAKAYLAGVTFQPSNQIGLSAIFRNYDVNYHSFFSNAFSAGSNNTNERGLYISIYANLTSKITLTAFADHYQHDWLEYRVDAPSRGKEYNVFLSYSPNSRTNFIFRYNINYKQLNQSNTDAVAYPFDESGSCYRIHLETHPTKSLTLKSRVEYVTKQKQVKLGETKGFLIYQDIIYHEERLPWTINLRYAIFDTDSYNERIYTYESDVLYNFAVPAYYDQGSRFYILGKYSISKDVNIWVKYASTYYFNKEVIGTGMDEIKGRVKSEVKAQIVIKL